LLQFDDHIFVKWVGENPPTSKPQTSPAGMVKRLALDRQLDTVPEVARLEGGGLGVWGNLAEDHGSKIPKLGDGFTDFWNFHPENWGK